MRVAAISDIHGNLPALEAVLAEIDGEGVDQIVVVGDTVHGPWPAEVADLLVEREALCVRGNADREVVERSDRYGPLAPWSADRLGERRLAIARDWPLTVELAVDGLGTVLVCHSTPTDDDPVYTRITPDAELVDLLGPVAADVLVIGHTHMQYDRTLASGLRVVNPGSVGNAVRGRAWRVLGAPRAGRRVSPRGVRRRSGRRGHRGDARPARREDARAARSSHPTPRARPSTSSRMRGA